MFTVPDLLIFPAFAIVNTQTANKRLDLLSDIKESYDPNPRSKIFRDGNAEYSLVMLILKSMNAELPYDPIAVIKSHEKMFKEIIRTNKSVPLYYVHVHKIEPSWGVARCSRTREGHEAPRTRKREFKSESEFGQISENYVNPGADIERYRLSFPRRVLGS